MQLETFRGRDLSAVCADAREALGDDVIIVSTRTAGMGPRPWIEVRAAAAEDLARLQRLVVSTRVPLRPTRPPGAASAATGGGRRPRIVALVGPTGAGKTTTLAKLAVHPDAFGESRVGLLTFDTHRAAAFDQLHAYADAAGLPCELVYDASELGVALKRLGDCDAILVDTPGRSPRSEGPGGGWRALLDALRPDEVHLVVPATTRYDLVAQMRAAFEPLGVTHGLLTKLDEVPVDPRVALTVSALGLPMRWIADGQEVPADLSDAAGRVLGSLGMARPAMEAA